MKPYYTKNAGFNPAQKKKGNCRLTAGEKEEANAGYYPA